VLDRERAAVAEPRQRPHARLDVDDAVAPGAGVVRLAPPEHVLEVHVRDVAVKLFDRANGVVPLGSPPAGVDGGRHRPLAGLDLGQNLVRCPLGMILDRERDAVLPEDRHQRGRLAREAAADHARADGARELAGAVDAARPDPGRVGRDRDPVPAERIARDRHVLLGRPVRSEVRAPEVDRSEAERATAAEQRVEPVAVRLDRGECVVGGAVALGPVVDRPAGLARDLVRGHERDRLHAACGDGRGTSRIVRS
jgi:hypothetical protein